LEVATQEKSEFNKKKGRTLFNNKKRKASFFQKKEIEVGRGHPAHV